MEIHVHNGVIRREHVDFSKIAVIEKLDGFYVRFMKKDRSIVIGTLSPVLHPSELDLYKIMMKRYRISSKTILKDEILYGIVYGKGVKKRVYDAPNNPIMIFYNLTKGNKHISLDKFEEYCLKQNLPMASIVYDGPLIDEYKTNYIVRPIEEVEIKVYDDLHRRLFWHI